MAASLLLKRWVLTLFLLFFLQSASAQLITNYLTSGSSGSMTKISGTEPGGAGATRDDNNTTYQNIPIGFDFWYMGKRHTHVSASTNGWFTFGTSLSESLPNNSLSGNGSTPIIAPLWDDLATYEGISVLNLGVLLWTDPYGGFSYQTSGSVGSRVLTLEWFRMQWSLSATGATLSFQAKLHENGNVEFVYGRGPYTLGLTSGNYGAGAVAAATASAGITGGNNSFLSLSNLSNLPTVNVNTEVDNISVLPTNGQTYVFNPTEVASPTNLTFTGEGNSGFTLNWTDNSGNDEIGFAIYQSATLNGTYTHLATTPANVTSYTVTGLAASTTRHYRVYAVRENLSSGFAAGNRATLANCNAVNILPLQVPTTNIVANYRLNGNANDFYNINTGTLQGSPTNTADRFSTTGSAYNFNGTTQYISTANSYANPNNFTISIWFKTASTAGGSLLGFNLNRTGTTGNHDRHLYLGADGRIYFGVFGGAVRTVNSEIAYNDDKWHMATATMSSTAGITLYIDGVFVANNSAGTSGENYTGYWRMASQAFNGAWPSTPTANFYAGALDDAFIFNRVLSASEIATLYNSPYGVQNNGPLCVGTALQLTAPAVAGAQYNWTGPNGFTSTLQNPILTYALSAAGTYSVTVNVGGCTDVARTNVASSTVAGNWVGGSNTDWANAANWCNGVVPTASVNVTVPSGRSNYPTVSTEQAANNLTVQTAASVTITNSLSVAGTISNSGTITISNGRMVFNGATAQTIPANVFAGNLIKDLTISNAAGVTLNGALRLTGTLTATNGIFNANGNLTLASSASQTAQVASIVSTASVRGKVFVERYLRGGPKNPYRGYRMLSSPVYDNTTEFRSNDVQGNRTAAFSQLKDDVIITGKDGSANGFDNSHNNGTGAWIYNGGYVAIPNISTSVNAGRSMYFLFRGNRDNLSGKTVSPYVDVENVVLDFEGVLNQQDVTVGLGTVGFHLLGNPYAATIDWSSPNWGTDKGNVNNAIWIWNPVARSYATYINNVSTLDGSRYIASGQGFFVQALGVTAIKFKENIKASTEQPPMLMSANRQIENSSQQEVNQNPLIDRSLLRVGMKPMASFGESEMVVVFDENSSLAFTGEDAAQFEGEIVNISTIADNQRLAINFLPPSSFVMEIPMSVSANANGNYVMNFDLSEYHQGHTIALKDNYLNTTIPIISGSVYSFNIDRANSLTFGAARFSIIVSPPNVLPVGLLYFNGKKQNDGVLLSWETSEEINNAGFKLFRATEDGTFQFLTDISPKGAGAYSYIDRSPLPGRNYYKLVQVDFDGAETEAEPIAVNFVIGEHRSVVIYPNPVIDNFTIKIDDLQEEVYELNLYDTIGHRIKTIRAAKSALLDGLKVDVLGVNSGVFILRLVEFGTGKTVVEEKILKLQ